MLCGLQESEYMRYGYEYFGHTQLPAELNDEWADDLEDEARHDGIGEQACDSSLELIGVYSDIARLFRLLPG